MGKGKKMITDDPTFMPCGHTVGGVGEESSTERMAEIDFVFLELSIND